jgi:hypothetical protein
MRPLALRPKQHRLWAGWLMDASISRAIAESLSQVKMQLFVEEVGAPSPYVQNESGYGPAGSWA